MGVIVTSWWGQNSYEDRLVPAIMDAAARHGIKVAWHLEPCSGRTAASTVADVNYLIGRYGNHAAFYRDAAHGNRSAYYVFESLRITDWTPVNAVRGTAIVLAQTTDTSKVAHFGGMYTYSAPHPELSAGRGAPHGRLCPPSRRRHYGGRRPQVLNGGSAHRTMDNPRR